VAAVERGSGILREGGSAIDAVVWTVAALEDHCLFNAGFGSVLTLEGRVEMDAGIWLPNSRRSRQIRRRKHEDSAKPRREPAA
jgi:L-asparaginase / beta-aspartyl-peptidase